jgi:hypothetical protein
VPLLTVTDLYPLIIFPKYLNLLFTTMFSIHSWSWALLGKPPIVQLLKNFPAFYGTRRFIIVFTRALHWSLFWARSIQPTPSHPVSLRSILILSTHLRLGLPSGLHHERRILIKFYMKLISLISPDNYYSEFYHRACALLSQFLFEIELISLWILERNISPLAWISSAVIWSLLGYVYLFDFAIAISTSEEY